MFLLAAIAIAFLLLIKNIGTTSRIETERATKPLIETTATDMPIDPIDPVLGNQGASITIVQFADINSEDSRAVFETIKKFITANPTKARLIWKNFPGSTFFAQNEMLVHQAAYCVYKQDKNKFWDYISELSATGRSMRDEKTMSDLATKVGVNSSAWQSCLKSTEAVSRIESEISLARSLNLKIAPVIFINNKKVNYLDEIDLDDLLKEIIKTY